MQGIQGGFITITLVDGKGNMVGSSQNTPVTSNIGGNYAVFKCQVHYARNFGYHAYTQCVCLTGRIVTVTVDPSHIRVCNTYTYSRRLLFAGPCAEEH